MEVGIYIIFASLGLMALANFFSICYDLKTRRRNIGVLEDSINSLKDQNKILKERLDNFRSGYNTLLNKKKLTAYVICAEGIEFLPDDWREMLEHGRKVMNEKKT